MLKYTEEFLLTLSPKPPTFPRTCISLFLVSEMSCGSLHICVGMFDMWWAFTALSLF